MSVQRCVFLGTPELARYCLESMLKDEHFQIVAVVTQPDRPAGRKMQLQPSPVKKFALEKGLKVLSPESINTAEALSEIASLRAELAVVVAFGQILSQKFLALYPERVVNVHGSLLPRWRGAAPIQRAIMAGDKETGVCLQVMVKKLDAGGILGSRPIVISPDMSALELLEAMKTPAADLLHVELMDYLRGNLVATPQDEALITYAAKIDKSEGEIEWTWSAQKINNYIRGLAMGPGAHTRRAGKVLKLHKAEIAYCKAGSLPGTVVACGEDSVTLACGEQALRLLEVQPESRSRMPMREYLRGYPLKVGDVLGK